MQLSQKTKHFLAPIIGFGIAGMLWGIQCYFQNDPDLMSPFQYIGIIFSFGIIGSLSLVLFSENIKKILLVIVAGTIGSSIGVFLPMMFSYWLFLLGGIIRSYGSFFFPYDLIEKFINLNYSLFIGDFWLQFLFAGIIIGLFYALILKARIKRLVLFSGLGFALSSIISPIIGNLIGNYIFNSLLASYLITFTLIGIIFSLSLILGIKRQ